MHLKSFLSALLPTVLLSAPLCAAASLSGADIVPNDTVQQYTLPAQERREGEEIDWQRSVAPPVPWLTATDNYIEIHDANGRTVLRVIYPSLNVTDGADAPLAHGLHAWNEEIATAFRHSPAHTAYKAMQRSEERMHGDGCCTDQLLIRDWGRVDEQMVSFLMKGAFYAGGPHPYPYADAVTFDRRTGRQIALEELVTSREMLLDALAAELHRAYGEMEELLFSNRIRDKLAAQHPEEQGLGSFRWYMAADGSLIVYYAPYEIGHYSAGSFVLTITREAAPQLFTAAYPMR